MEYEIYDGDIVECSVGEEYASCHFFDCQIIGINTMFRDCVFTNCTFDMHGDLCCAVSCFFIQCHGSQ